MCWYSFACLCFLVFRICHESWHRAHTEEHIRNPRNQPNENYTKMSKRNLTSIFFRPSLLFFWLGPNEIMPSRMYFICYRKQLSHKVLKCSHVSAHQSTIIIISRRHFDSILCYDKKPWLCTQNDDISCTAIKLHLREESLLVWNILPCERDGIESSSVSDLRWRFLVAPIPFSFYRQPFDVGLPLASVDERMEKWENDVDGIMVKWACNSF